MAYTALKLRYEHRQIFLDVLAELDRQRELHAGETARDHAESAYSIEWSADRALTILTEEVGEVARAIIEGDGDGLRIELVQVAAVAVAMIEGLDTAREAVQ